MAFMRVFIWLWPVFHIWASPPIALIKSTAISDDFTSRIIGVPGWRWTISWAKKAVRRSPDTWRPLASTMPIRSPSPSNPMPKSAFAFATDWRSMANVSGSTGLGWWFGKWPSMSPNKTVCVPLISLVAAIVAGPEAPFPQSQITL